MIFLQLTLPKSSLEAFMANSKSNFNLAFAFVAIALVASINQQSFGQAGLPEFHADFVTEATPRDADESEIRQIKRRNSAPNSRIRAARSAALDALYSGAALNEEAKKYFSGYYFPSMAVPADRTELSKLGELRDEFLKRYVGPKTRGAARTEMIRFTLETMRAYAENKNLPAAARLNAVYIISQLDTIPAFRIDGQAPVPSKEALNVLISTFVGNGDDYILSLIHI